MTTILFMDDDTVRCSLFFEKHPEAYIVHTAQECINQLSRQSWDWVCLDHDLGLEENNSGSVVVKWIIEHRPSIKNVVVHSWNDKGNKMHEDLLNSGYQSQRVTFGPALLKARF